MTLSTTQPQRGVEPAIVTDGMSVWGHRAGERVLITDNVALRVDPGEAVAIVGESGSGKSVTARALTGLLPRGLEPEGVVSVSGHDLAQLSRSRLTQLRGSEIAMILQDPFTSLNPSQRIGDFVTAALRTSQGKRLPGTVRRAEAVRRLAEVGIMDSAAVTKYPFELSGGMRQRVAIAAAIAESPKILVADEPTTALDVTTQAEILKLLNQLRHSHDLALILITHDLRVAASVCDRVYVMYAGSVLEELTASELLTAARHPYTMKLTAADPPLNRTVAWLPSIPGAVPAPGNWPAGCRFAPRCSFAVDQCHEAEPAPVELSPSHLARCLRLDDALVSTEESSAERATSTTTADVVVSTKAARKVFGAKVAVAGADIEVRRGESVGIVGESGSGKTSLARMLVGLETPTSGAVTVAGVELGKDLSRSQWQTVRSTIQMAFQDPSSTLNPFRTVGSTLREALQLTSNEALQHRTDELLELVGLNPAYAGRRPRQLSGGERQRVAIARALAREPQVVVCDEVVSALDVSVQAHVLNLLNRLREQLGLGYVFITHDLAVVRQVTDRVYVMKAGEIVEQGPTDQVLENPQHPYTQRLIESIPAAPG